MNAVISVGNKSEPLGRSFPTDVLIPLAIISMSLCSVTFSQERIYARLAGVAGESNRAGRADWIDVTGLGSGVSGDPESGTARTLGAPEAGPFILRKRIDKSSPYLLRGMLQGKVFEGLRIDIERGPGVETSYRMRGVRLTQQKIYKGQGSSDLFEEVGFQFDVIEWHNTKTDANGGIEHVGSTWNLATNEGGVLNQPDVSPPTISPVSPLKVIPGEIFEFRVGLIDPAKTPENLVFTVLTPEEGLVKILGVEGDGLARVVSLQVGNLQNGTDRMKLSLSDGVRSSTREVPIVIAGEKTPYENYLAAFLAEEMEDDPDVIRPLRDPDGDQMTNVMEFFLGTDPSAFTLRDEALTMTQKKKKDGTEILIRYFRTVDEVSLRETFEGSRDLKKWEKFGEKGGPAIEITRIGEPNNGYAPMEARVFIDDSPQADGAEDDTNYYMRLSVKGTL